MNVLETVFPVYPKYEIIDENDKKIENRPIITTVLHIKNSFYCENRIYIPFLHLYNIK